MLLTNAMKSPVYKAARTTGTGSVTTLYCGARSDRARMSIDVSPYPIVDAMTPARNNCGIGKMKAKIREDREGEVWPSNNVG